MSELKKMKSIWDKMRTRPCRDAGTKAFPLINLFCCLCEKALLTWDEVGYEIPGLCYSASPEHPYGGVARAPRIFCHDCAETAKMMDKIGSIGEP